MVKKLNYGNNKQHKNVEEKKQKQGKRGLKCRNVIAITTRPSLRFGGDLWERCKVSQDCPMWHINRLF
jgi:hypothetical protein